MKHRSTHVFDDMEDKNPESSPYTQKKAYGDRTRTHEELKEDQIRKPRLYEGISFSEKI